MSGPERSFRELYRVFPFLGSADPDEPGGALYIPPQGGGRIDNPDLYSVLYLSTASAGAVAEALGRFPEWSKAVLAGSPSLPGSRLAVARYRAADTAAVCDLDDPEQLRALGLRPSDVVSRDYGRTRAWARRIYGEERWSGVSWWSYYDSRWASQGWWDVSGLKVEEVAPLEVDHPAVLEAGRVIVRRIEGRK